MTTRRDLNTQPTFYAGSNLDLPAYDYTCSTMPATYAFQHFTQTSLFLTVFNGVNVTGLQHQASLTAEGEVLQLQRSLTLATLVVPQTLKTSNTLCINRKVEEITPGRQRASRMSDRFFDVWLQCKHVIKLFISKSILFSVL